MFHTDLLRLIVLFTTLLFMFMFHSTFAVHSYIISRLPNIQSVICFLNFDCIFNYFSWGGDIIDK